MTPLKGPSIWAPLTVGVLLVIGLVLVVRWYSSACLLECVPRQVVVWNQGTSKVTIELNDLVRERDNSDDFTRRSSKVGLASGQSKGIRILQGMGQEHKFQVLVFDSKGALTDSREFTDPEILGQSLQFTPELSIGVDGKITAKLATPAVR